jgi:hypothetical protein
MRATQEHRDDAVHPIVPAGAGRHVRVDRRSWLAAERALDQVLADSFPASDPPSWTLGIARPKSLGRAVSVDLPRHNERSFRCGLVSLAGAASIALFVPFAILLIGLPLYSWFAASRRQSLGAVQSIAPQARRLWGLDGDL